MCPLAWMQEESIHVQVNAVTHRTSLTIKHNVTENAQVGEEKYFSLYPSELIETPCNKRWRKTKVY